MWKAKVPDIILFDDLKALKNTDKRALFFTLDKDMCDKARERGFNCRSPEDYIDSEDLELKNPDYELMYEWLSKLTTYDDINLGLLTQITFIRLEAMQKFHVYKVLKELFDKEKPESIKIVAKRKPMYRWDDGLGYYRIPVTLVESMADNKRMNLEIEDIDLTTPIKNELFSLAAPFLLRTIERSTESIIRMRKGSISKSVDAKIIIFLHSDKNWHVIEPVLKYLGEHGVELLIIIQSHGFFNFGLSKKNYEQLQDLGDVRSFESYQNKSIYKIMDRERRHLKELWHKIENDNEFQKEFLLDDTNVWNVFKDHFWFYYAVQFPRLVKYIETGKRIVEIEKPEVVVFIGDGPAPSRTFSTVAEKFQVPTILISHAINFPTKIYIPTCKYVAVWGFKFKEYMISNGLDTKQVVVTGAPQYDALTKLGGKEELRREFGFPINRHIITFATQPYSEQITRKLVHEVLRSIKKLDEVFLVIKPHPREKPGLYENFVKEVFTPDILSNTKVMVLFGVNIGQLIKASNLLLTVDSAVALESNVIGTPVLTLNFTEQKDIFYSKEGGAIGVENSETLTDTIYKALYDEKFKEMMHVSRNKFLQKCTYSDDGKATERAANLVMQVMEESKREKD